MVELTYLSLKKTTFFVGIFEISHCVFTQISIGRARWMRYLIPHPTSTHTAYFWRTPLPQKKIPEKTWWWCHHHVFSGISCFWGSRVHQKYTVWVLVGCGIKFRIQRVPTLHTFDKPHYPENKKYLKKHDDDIIITLFSGISCFLGSRAHQKYASWYFLDLEFNFTSNELSQ